MTHIPRIICGGCLIEMRPSKTGICVEMLTKDAEPYYKVNGDAFVCPRCSRTIVTGFATEPLTHVYDEDYENHTEVFKAKLL